MVDAFSTTARAGRKRGATKKKRSPLNPDLSMESDEGEQQESEAESDHEEEEAAYSGTKEMLDDEMSGSEEEMEAPKKPKKRQSKKSATVAVVEKNAEESMVGDSRMVDRESSASVSPARQDTSLLIDDKGNNYYGK